MALRRVAGFRNAAVEQHLEHRAAVVRCAADQKIIRCRPPVLLEPLDVRLKASAGCNEGRGAHGVARASLLHDRGEEHAVVDLEIDHLRLISDLDPERFGGQIQRVQHRTPTAQEERIGAAEAQGAAERGLVAHAVLRQPIQHGLRLGDHVARQRLVRVALRHREQIAEELNSQYLIGYSSARAGDGQYHSIRVKVKGGDYRVRARNGYVDGAVPASR